MLNQGVVNYDTPDFAESLSIESSDSFGDSPAASIATGWSEPVPGREFHPLKSSAFHGALLRQLSCSDMAIYANCGTFRTLKVITQSGMGRAANNMRQGFAIQRAQRTE